MHFYFCVIFVLLSIFTTGIRGTPRPTHHHRAAHAAGQRNDKYLERKKRAFWNLPINVNEWLYNNDDFYDDLIYSASHYHN